MFPSLNEGFGLPVAESLAHGTPVITSDYGSMKEIADDSGGCPLVDPRDDDQIRAAMRSLLTDGALLAELRRAARTARTKTWDEYAAEAYDYLVTGA
jgi:glycosyltransferase involved in cell wall biosynthesis